MNVGWTRRAFLAFGASLTGAGWAGLVAPRAFAASEPDTLNLALRRSAFSPLLGQPFRIAHEAGALTVVLSQISDLEPSVRPGSEDQFSLIFADARRRPALSQRTYSVSHPRRGRISLFVVPVGDRHAAQHYQVIVDSRPLAVAAS